MLVAPTIVARRREGLRKSLRYLGGGDVGDDGSSTACAAAVTFEEIGVGVCVGSGTTNGASAMGALCGTGSTTVSDTSGFGSTALLEQAGSEMIRVKPVFIFYDRLRMVRLS